MDFLYHSISFSETQQTTWTVQLFSAFYNFFKYHHDDISIISVFHEPDRVARVLPG